MASPWAISLKVYPLAGPGALEISVTGVTGVTWRLISLINMAFYDVTPVRASILVRCYSGTGVTSEDDTRVRFSIIGLSL